MVKRGTLVAICAAVCVVSLLIGSAGTVVFGRELGLGVTARPTATAEPTATPSPGNYSRLDEIRAVIHNQALNDVSDDKLLDGASYGMAVGTGDPYTEFFTAEDWKQFQQQEAGNYVGIGVAVNVDPTDKLITAVTVYRNSPAEKGGMIAGDKIVKVDSTDVSGMSLEQVVKLVRGEPGSQVTITVLRDKDTKELTMTRANVEMDFVDPPKLLTGGVGYIRILEFSGDIDKPNNAATLFDKYVKQLKGQGMKGLILDLRSNPGGSLNIVAPIADELLPKGPIVTMVDRSGNKIEGSEIDSGASSLGLPLVVLVNENSASASELLSGNIQDYKVGKLIGVKTYGKGVAQSFQPLHDGSWLKYTAEKYLTGGGRCPQTVGITPDIVLPLDDAVKANPLLLATDKDNQYQRAIVELTNMINGK